MSTLASTLIRDYICCICYSNLKMIPGRDEDGNIVVVCAKDPEHYGFWSKTYYERRKHQEQVEGAELRYNSKMCEMLGLPNPNIGFAKSIVELGFGE